MSLDTNIKMLLAAVVGLSEVQVVVAVVRPLYNGFSWIFVLAYVHLIQI